MPRRERKRTAPFGPQPGENAISGAWRLGGMQLEIQEARTYINQWVHLAWTDRRGREIQDVVQVYGVEFVPLYGPCLLTSGGDVRLDRVVACHVSEKRTAA